MLSSLLKGIQVKCVYCKGGHISASCERVIVPRARFEILKRDGRCFVCLSLDHKSTSCEKNCRRCNGNHQSICQRKTHLTSEHDLSANKNSQETQNSTLVTQSTEVSQLPQSTTTASSGSKGTVLLQTASAIARNKDSTKSTRVKILFDNGSQRSYVTDNLKSRLDLKSTKKEMLHLNTFGAKTFQKQKCDVLTLFLEDVNEETSKVFVLSFPTICSTLPSHVDANNYPHLHGLKLADYSNSEDSIDVLIGSDHYWDLVTSEIVRGDFGPTAVNSKFSWLLSGQKESVINQETTMTNLTTAGKSNSLFDYTQDALVDTLKQFWETESIGIKEVSEIMESQDGFNKQVHFNGQRYEVPLPFHDNHPAISSDYELCVNCLKSLQRKLLKEPELIREYNQIIEEQLSKGIVERVAAEKDSEEEDVHYLPHHAVIQRDRETTKLRIVYDGSAKPPKRTHSLNDCLETGPNYTPQLFDTLVNFRWHKISLMADIEKAFLMVGINERDRDML